MPTKRELEDQVADLKAKVEKFEKTVRDITGTFKTHVAVVQDISGSMSGREKATINGYNEFLSGLRADAKDDSTADYRITLTQFDTTIETRYEAKPLAEVRDMVSSDFVVRGMTALNDAIGSAITSVEKMMQPGDEATILIMTDGGENSSRTYSGDKIKSMVKDKEGTGRWTFVFLGADMDAFESSRGYGMHVNNSVSYTNDAASIMGTYRGMATATSAKRRAGGAATMDFASMMEPNPIKAEDGDDDGEGNS